MARPQHPRSSGQRQARWNRRSRTRQSEPFRPWLAGLGIGALLVFCLILAYELTGEESPAPPDCFGDTHIFLVDAIESAEAESAARILDEVLEAVNAIGPGEQIVISRIGDSQQTPPQRIAEICKPPENPEAPAALREDIAAGLQIRRQGPPLHSPIVEAIEDAERAFGTSHNAPKESRKLHIYSHMVQNSPWWPMAELAVQDWCDARKFREARNGEVSALGRPVRIYTQRVDIHWIKHPRDIKLHSNEQALKCFWGKLLKNATVTWSEFIPLAPRQIEPRNIRFQGLRE